MEGKEFFSLLSGNHAREARQLYLATVSGVASTTPRMIRYFDHKVPAIDIITTKSFQVKENPGNREPIICETSLGNFGNSVGLRNPGMDAVYPELKQVKDEGLRAFLNVSVSADCPEDFIILVKKFDAIADSIELNFSCPHAAAGYGASIGCDAGIASSYVREIRKAVQSQKSLLFVKLTPNVDDIGLIAKACIEAGADGIVAINTTGPALHVDRVANAPILQNSLGGKGGCSGSWVKERALACVASIREAVGPTVPIIGMGGIATGADCRKLMDAGADAVGIGSALGRVNQKLWPSYLVAVKHDFVDADSHAADMFLSTQRQMAYSRMPVTSINFHGNDTIVLTLDGKLPTEAGEFAFLWLPGVGEKPFSLAGDDPVTFIIKRRGTFTAALWNLQVGSDLYVRGVYGAPLVNAKTARAILIAGGTGIAVLPALARKLQGQNTKMDILVGTSEREDEKPLLADELAAYGNFTCVADDGIPGRVLSLIPSLHIDETTACYLVGPEKFMAIAADKLIAAGADKRLMYLSMERNTRCGIGMCGECACGDRLTCQWGTFMEYGYLEQEMPQLLGRKK
ncbi:MAG: dihydroorotate dehydrogenase [Spirochaetia bacterium]|jgi:dihydroorotate dehydrogenase (NAD+) catalytic subunit|nr:dihydroorotate dehydrogenase [Spirochaetia bacterium]